MTEMLSTCMMTLGFMMMVYPQQGVKNFLTPLLVGTVLRNAYSITYEHDAALEAAISKLDTLH